MKSSHFSSIAPHIVAMQRTNILVIALSASLIAGVFDADARTFSNPPTVGNKPQSDVLRGVWKARISDYREGSITRNQLNREASATMAEWLRPSRFNSEFPEGFQLDMSKKGVSEVLSKGMAVNQPNAKGSLRELKFMNAIEHPNSPLVLVEANDRKMFQGKITEYDIVAMEPKSRGIVVYESKDWKIQNRQQMDHAKDQISRIIARAKSEGVEQVTWVNREGISDAYLDEFTEHVESLGGKADFNASTGPKTVAAWKAQSFAGILERDAKAVRWRASAGKIAKRGIPIAGTVIEVGLAGNTFVGWQRGRVSNRDMVGRGGGAIGGIGGAAGGAAIGGAIGFEFVGVGAIPGAIIGGVIGGLAGDKSGELAATALADGFYFKKMDEEENQALFAHLQTTYSSEPP